MVQLHLGRLATAGSRTGGGGGGGGSGNGGAPATPPAQAQAEYVRCREAARHLVVSGLGHKGDAAPLCDIARQHGRLQAYLYNARKAALTLHFEEVAAAVGLAREVDGQVVPGLSSTWRYRRYRRLRTLLVPAPPPAPCCCCCRGCCMLLLLLAPGMGPKVMHNTQSCVPLCVCTCLRRALPLSHPPMPAPAPLLAPPVCRAASQPLQVEYKRRVEASGPLPAAAPAAQAAPGKGQQAKAAQAPAPVENGYSATEPSAALRVKRLGAQATRCGDACAGWR